ncbi:MAG: endolytic transglycosylase MltG, partial [Actinomycetota bacterium]|nr:endolytic transglycosylase MltG [Actinomycetota bacterium]
MDRSQAIRERREAAGRGRHERPTRSPRPDGGRTKRGGAGRVIGAILLVIVVLAAVVASVAWYFLYQPDAEVTAGKPVVVVIKSGASTAAIAQTLSDAGVIENAMMFRVQSRLAEADGTLRAGEYELSTGMSYDLVLAKLAEGPTIVYFEVPIPEGFTARQIAARFAARAQVSEDELLALMTTGADEFVAEHPYLEGAYGGSLEGYLFPATYTVKEGTTAREIVKMLLT